MGGAQATAETPPIGGTLDQAPDRRRLGPGPRSEAPWTRPPIGGALDQAPDRRCLGPGPRSEVPIGYALRGGCRPRGHHGRWPAVANRGPRLVYCFTTPPMCGSDMCGSGMLH